MATKEQALLNYYKDRDKKILYQREYDKTHKEQAKVRNETRKLDERRKHQQRMNAHAKEYFFKPLFEKYQGCQLCKSINNLEIHHKKYTENIEDCMLLCQECHKKIHRKV